MAKKARTARGRPAPILEPRGMSEMKTPSDSEKVDLLAPRAALNDVEVAGVQLRLLHAA
jgi:hypothetical protein